MCCRYVVVLIAVMLAASFATFFSFATEPPAYVLLLFCDPHRTQFLLCRRLVVLLSEASSETYIATGSLVLSRILVGEPTFLCFEADTGLLVLVGLVGCVLAAFRSAYAHRWILKRANADKGQL